MNIFEMVEYLNRVRVRKHWIRECTSELGLPIDLREVLVRTQEEADALRFLGSPTVQINGIDIDPSARAINDFGFM